MKQGATYLLAIKLDVNLEDIAEIIFTLQGDSSVQKRYPYDVSQSDGLFSVPLTQEDTMLLCKTYSRKIEIEAQINYTNLSVSKTSITEIFLRRSLATEIADGNAPSGIAATEVQLEIVGDVLVATVSPEYIKESVDEYFAENPYLTEDIKDSFDDTKQYVDEQAKTATEAADSAKSSKESAEAAKTAAETAQKKTETAANDVQSGKENALLEISQVKTNSMTEITAVADNAVQSVNIAKSAALMDIKDNADGQLKSLSANAQLQISQIGKAGQDSIENISQISTKAISDMNELKQGAESAALSAKQSEQSASEKVESIGNFSSVAKSGSFNDLKDVPELIPAQELRNDLGLKVNLNWGAINKGKQLIVGEDGNLRLFLKANETEETVEKKKINKFFSQSFSNSVLAPGVVLNNSIPKGSTLSKILILSSRDVTVYVFSVKTGIIIDTFVCKNDTVLEPNKTYDEECYIGGLVGAYYAQGNSGDYGTVNQYWDFSVSDGVATVNKNHSSRFQYAVEVEIEERKQQSISVSDKTILTVAKDGTGDFDTINDAVSYADAYMNRDLQVTIIVFPGTYNEVVNVKGARFLSIVGINRETCIIRDDSGEYNNCPLRIEGNSYVANLTLISTHKNASNFVIDGVLQKNPSYAIHIDDRHNDDDNDYVCTIYNCKLYSEQNPAVGIGLDKNQTVNILNCEIVSHIADDLINVTQSLDGIWGWKPDGGALFYHAKYRGSYADESGYQRLVVKDCIIRNNRKNVVFGEDGGQTEQVELVFCNNCGYSDANGFSFVKGLTEATISPLSFGNNMDGMNYTSQ